MALAALCLLQQQWQNRPVQCSGSVLFDMATISIGVMWLMYNDRSTRREWRTEHA